MLWQNSFSPVVSICIAVNCLFYVLQHQFSQPLLTWLALWPLPFTATSEALAMRWNLPSFELWQLVTYAFLHANIIHLATNMLGLWMLGRPLEQYWGWRRFSAYYLICLTGAGCVQLLVASIAAGSGSYYPTIGASGAVFGILLAIGMLFPDQRLMFLLLPIAIKAKWFVLAFGLFELWAGITGTQAGIAHFAHLGGMLVGFLVLLYWRTIESVR